MQAAEIDPSMRCEHDRDTATSNAEDSRVASIYTVSFYVGR